MISRNELIRAREALLDRTVRYFSARPEVLGIFVAGSLPAGTADAYSDIDLRVITTPAGHARLVAERLDSPSQWGDLLFNEWLDGTEHCISHFRPCLKIDVFYWSADAFRASPWLKFPAIIPLDRTGAVAQVLKASADLPFETVPDIEVSRVLSKALAGLHEVVRRVRRGELVFAQTLLEELRSNMIQLDGWLQRRIPTTPSDLKLEPAISAGFRTALQASYPPLDASAIEAAAIALSDALHRQITDLHATFEMRRSLADDLAAAEIVRNRQLE